MSIPTKNDSSSAAVAPSCGGLDDRRACLKRSIIGVMLLFVAAFAMRLVAINVHGGGHDYIEWAMANHFGLIVEAYVDSARLLLDGQGYRELLRPPGQPGLFAALMALGVGFDGWRATQSFFDAMAVVLLALAALRLGVRPGIALALALPVALLPPWSVGATLLLAEWMAPLAVALVLVLAAFPPTPRTPTPPDPTPPTSTPAPATRAHPIRSSARWIALGAAISLAALFRPDLIVLAPLVAGVWALRWLAGRERWPALALLVIVTTTPLAAWGFHNLRTHGTFVLLSTSGGSALYQGLGAVENPHGYVMSDVLTEKLLNDRGMEFGSPEGDRELKRLWREAVVAHPGHVLATIQHRWSRMLAHVDQPLGERSVVTDRLLWIGWLALVPASLILAHRRRLDLVLVLWIPVLLGLMATGLTHAEARYVRFVPFTGLLAIGVTLTWCVDLFGRRAPQRSAALATIVGACAVVLLVPTTLLDAAKETRRVADGRRLMQSHEAALPFVERALAITTIGDATWIVETSRLRSGEQPYSAAAVATIDTDGANAIAVRVRGCVLDGGFAISLVDDHERRLDAIAIDGEGPWTLIAGVRDRRTRLVIANRNPLRESSTLRIDGIDLLIDAPADAPAMMAVEAIVATQSVDRGATRSVGIVAHDDWVVEGDGRMERLASDPSGVERVRLVTDTGAATYQASASIVVDGERWLAIRYRLRIESGGASIGILGADRGRWLASAAHPDAGTHEGTLTVATRDRERIVLMLSNHRPGVGGSSEIIVESIEILGAEAARLPDDRSDDQSDNWSEDGSDDGSDN